MTQIAKMKKLRDEIASLLLNFQRDNPNLWVAGISLRHSESSIGNKDLTEIDLDVRIQNEERGGDR